MKNIPEYPDYYADEEGNIYSAKRRYGAGTFTDTAGTKLLSAHPSGDGRKSVVLFRNGIRRTMAVHRLILETFVGPCPPGMEACHNDGDKLNNRLDNLRWDTRSANSFDAVRHGTAGGERNGNAKLKKEQVIAIRHDDRTPQKIANDYGISRSAIRLIKQRRTWQELS